MYVRLNQLVVTLAAAACLAGCGGDKHLDVNMSGADHGPDDIAITTTSGAMTLAVRSDSIRMRMSYSARNKVTAELKNGPSDTASGMGAWIARKAKGMAAKGLSMEMSMPIANVESAAVDKNGAIVIIYKGGVSDPFANTKVNQTPLMSAFARADAERFAALVSSKVRK